MTQEQPRLAERGSFLKRWPRAVPSAALLVFTLLLCIPLYNAPEHWDDFRHLQENPVIEADDGLYQIWFEPFKNLHYYPVVFSSFWIEHRLWGFTIWPYHVVNVVLHAVNTVLLMLVLQRLRIPMAFLIALIFACHPVHVESVVNISERKNLLSFMFFMLATLAYWRFADGAGPRRWLAYAAAIVSFILAIQSKTVVAVFPIVMLLAHIYREGWPRWRTLWPLLGFVILAIPQSMIIRFIEHNLVGATGPDFNFTVPEKFLIAGRALWFYAGKLLWPHPLMPIYPRWQIDVSAPWQYLFPAAYAAMFAALFALRKRIGQAPWLLAAAFFIIVGPALGFVTYYPMIMSYVSDHYVYLGSVPLIIAAVLAGRMLMRRVRAPQRLQAMVAAVVVTVLAGLFVGHGLLWRSALVIWAHNYQYNPQSSFVAANYGGMLILQGELDRADELITQALQNPHQRFTNLYNMGQIRSRQKRYPEAIAFFQQAVADYPEYFEAWRELGIHLQAVRDFPQAMRAFDAAIAIKPTAADPYFRKAYCQWVLGDAQGAVASARMAVKLDEHNALAQKVLNLVTTTPPPGLQQPATQYNGPSATQRRDN